MSFLGIVLLLSCHLCRSSPVVADPIKVQIQQWGVVGSQQVEEQVLLNGVSFTSQNQEFNTAVKLISANTLLPALISANKTSALRSHTILRSRECILEGSSVHWSDSVLHDGQMFLTLQHNVWTVHVPQALALKVVWDRVMQQTIEERAHLQDRCVKLMKELTLSAEQSDPEIPRLQFLIPILAVVVFGLLSTISVFIYKRGGLKHPGGIIGSIIHYHKGIV